MVLRKINNWRLDLLQVLYPKNCLICEIETPYSKNSLCAVCESELHFTHFEDFEDPSSLDQLFWGRVPLHATFALLYFEKGNATQTILHTLKYKNNKDIGVYFGRQIGLKLSKSLAFSDLDILITIPLHPKKEFERGYNQSEQLAIGLSEQLEIPIDKNVLKRVSFSESQTKKGKLMRWETMQERFITTPTTKNYQHIGIIDDVITTGSTLEVCVRLIQEIFPNAKISVIALAVAR